MVVALIILAVILAGCGSSECEADSECTATGKCKVARCVEGMCQSAVKPGCCGNLQCEEDAGETPCTCEQDCSFDKTDDGTCSGKLQLPNEYNDRTHAAEYVEYLCRDEECVVGVPSSEVEDKQLFSTHRGTVNFEVVSTITQPFVVGEGSFDIRVKLADTRDRVQLPVKITSLQLLSSGELLAEKSLDPPVLLQKVGAVHEDSLQVDPALDDAEEQREITVRVTYEFTQLDYDGDPNVVRSALERRYRNMWFVDPEKAP